jgi:hypothetical protein
MIKINPVWNSMNEDTYKALRSDWCLVKPQELWVLGFEINLKLCRTFLALVEG